MKKTLSVGLVLCLFLAFSACVHRIAPLSPRRTNTDFHRQAQTSTACAKCHEITAIGKGHQAGDDCLRCHRIVQGD